MRLLVVSLVALSLSTDARRERKRRDEDNKRSAEEEDRLRHERDFLAFDIN